MEIPRAVKLSITLPAELAREIRTTVGPGEVSRFLTDAARYYIRRRKLLRALDLGFGAWVSQGEAEEARSVSYLQRLRDVGRDRAERLRRLVSREDA